MILEEKSMSNLKLLCSIASMGGFRSYSQLTKPTQVVNLIGVSELTSKKNMLLCCLGQCNNIILSKFALFQLLNL